MTPWLTIIHMARGGLAVMAASLAIAFGLVQWSAYHAKQVHSELAQLQQSETEQNETLQQAQKDGLGLSDNLARFAALRKQGLIDQADRAGWVEQLLASRQQLGLPDTLVYALQAPKPLRPEGSAANADTGQSPDSAEPQISASYHDLEFGITHIHEEELLALLQAYKSSVRGRFRVNSCTLLEPTTNGLSARCTLRFFTMNTAGTTPGRTP